MPLFFELREKYKGPLIKYTMVKSQKQITRERTVVCSHDSKFPLRQEVKYLLPAVCRVRTDRYDNISLHPLTKDVTGA